VANGGGGSLNAFGRDFKTLGLSWTPELCAKDSDGDGFSNGFELGFVSKFACFLFILNGGHFCHVV
jgi:ribonuclease I